MKLFFLYHPKGGQLNSFCEKNKHEYEHITVIQAINLQHAFKLSQNDFNEIYADLGVRSTSVGDIFAVKEQPTDMTKNTNIFTYYIVNNVGFDKIDMSWLQYQHEVSDVELSAFETGEHLEQT